ncbi:TPA: DUF4049 domain-containing protein, partial [Escherichia coli]
NIFNKKHKQHMDDRLIHLIRSNAIASTPVYDNYFNNTTAFRPKPEDIFKCGPRFYVSTSKSIIKALINMHSFEIQLSPIG